jgi:diacylglycerol kinase family enzyme
MDVTIDGKSLGRHQMLLMAVMIGPATGGGFQVAPGADPCDGKLDVLFMPKAGRLKALQTMVLAKNGRHTKLKALKMLRAESLDLQGKRPIQAHVDGDHVKETRYEIRVKPGALTVMTPR